MKRFEDVHTVLFLLLTARGERHLMMGLDNIKIIHQKYFNNADPSPKEVMRIFYALCIPKKIHRA